MKMIDALKEEIDEMGITVPLVHPDLQLSDHLDKNQIKDLVERMEYRYDVSLKTSDVEACETVENIIELIKQNFR